MNKVLASGLGLLLLACSAQATRKLPYPAASNAKDFLSPDQYPVGIDTSGQFQPLHYVTTSSCFPAEAQVQTPCGPKPMQALRLGDKVLTMQPNGKPQFEEVFMFSHQDAAQRSAFVRLTTSSGRSLSATPGHYLWAQKSGQEPALTRAGDIKAGDELFELKDGQSVAQTIVDVSVRSNVGLYNPHTASGSIIVDGIAASSLTDFIPASLALHTTLTLPARAMYNILPTMLAEALNTAILSMAFGGDIIAPLRILVSSVKA